MTLPGRLLTTLFTAALACSAAAAAELPPKPSLADVIKGSRPSDWRPLDPANTLYMQLPGGRVVIELAPTFAPRHVANIRTLVNEHYFDGLAVIRSQDNWVSQWGDADEKNPKSLGTAAPTLPGEFTIDLRNDRQFTRLKDRDGYAPVVGHDNGADSGSGSSLYVVIGQAPRQLDRNITVVGRVVDGMPLLSTIPRGPGPMGFFDQPSAMVPITSVKFAADVPEGERSKLEVMRTDSAAFQQAVEAQRNRGGPWTKVAAGHIDLCNAPIPVRTISAN